jgi:hypothetical protein
MSTYHKTAVLCLEITDMDSWRLVLIPRIYMCVCNNLKMKLSMRLAGIRRLSVRYHHITLA